MLRGSATPGLVPRPLAAVLRCLLIARACGDGLSSRSPPAASGGLTRTGPRPQPIVLLRAVAPAVRRSPPWGPCCRGWSSPAAYPTSWAALPLGVSAVCASVADTASRMRACVVCFSRKTALGSLPIASREPPPSQV